MQPSFKIIHCSALCLGFLASQTAIAQPRNDAYVGVGAGYAIGNSKTNQSIPDSMVESRKNISGSGAVGQIFASWEHTTHDHLLWGFEASADVSSAKGRVTETLGNESFSASLKYDHSFDLALILGYKPRDLMSFYVKAAVSLGYWKLKGINDGQIVRSNGEHKFGFGPTIGMRMGLDRDNFISVEGRYRVYNKIKLTSAMVPGNGAMLDGPWLIKATPKVVTIMLRVSHRL